MHRFNHQIHHRKTTRLASHDYTAKATYFVTINCKNRIKHFGNVENEIMIPGEIGLIVEKFWLEIPEHYPCIELHEFQVMPEHLHGIIEHKGLPSNGEIRLNKFGKPISGSVSTILNLYKGAVKKWCNDNGFKKFQWQSRFHCDIIWDTHSYHIISQYIRDNPKNYGKGKNGKDIL